MMNFRQCLINQSLQEIQKHLKDFYSPRQVAYCYYYAIPSSSVPVERLFLTVVGHLFPKNETELNAFKFYLCNITFNSQMPRTHALDQAWYALIL